MSVVVVETPRLILRHLTWDDVDEMARIFADPIVMQFYPSTRTYEETKQYLQQAFNCYEEYGFGLWATIHKADNKFIGRCGLIPQIVEEQKEVEIGYMLAKEYWGQGLATEAASASRDYGWQLGYNRLISLIDPANIPSQKVARKVGLLYEKNALMWGKNLQVYSLSA